MHPLTHLKIGLLADEEDDDSACLSPLSLRFCSLSFSEAPGAIPCRSSHASMTMSYFFPLLVVGLVGCNAVDVSETKKK